ncbi:transposable element Tcb1 transposase [Trichonephila clavipes]|nr:transposable element Tcb1 transposase [Trichonephila clavipes]
MLVRRMPGKLLQSNCLRPRHTGPTPVVMIWGTISCDSRKRSWYPKRTDCQFVRQSAASPFVRLGKEEERWEVFDHSQSVFSLNWDRTEPNGTVTCMVLKAKANERRQLALCHDEFCGPRSGLCRSDGLTTRGDRVRSTTPAEDRYIVLSAKRNSRTTAQLVANQFLAASGKQISRKIVARRLRGGGLYARRPVVCVPLTRHHRTVSLQWCREHHNWTEQDWACVLFSDESRFSLSSDCRRQLIWHESGTAYSPENTQEKDRYPTCSIMV